MKLFIAMLMVLTVSSGVLAYTGEGVEEGVSTRSVIVDGQGYNVPQVWDVEDSNWHKLRGDSEGRIIVGSGQNPLLISTSPYTATAIDYDTVLTGTTFDTFTLGSAYSLIYVSSDTDIIVALTYAEAAAGYGDMQYAGITTPYPYSTQYVYIRTKSGLALTGGRVAVRGMR